jgi:deazaflavin-dependent oxidoreductase (nitroreductase family)
VTEGTEPLTQRLARLDRSRTVLLTHHGRKTGKAYEVRIWFLVDGDHVFLCTMNMDRQWTRNVQATPKVSLRIGDDVLEGEVSVVSDTTEMKRVVGLMKKKYLIARPYLWVKGQPDGAFRVRITA